MGSSQDILNSASGGTKKSRFVTISAQFPSRMKDPGLSRRKKKTLQKDFF
jgi:hypothetical protein